MQIMKINFMVLASLCVMAAYASKDDENIKPTDQIGQASSTQVKRGLENQQGQPGGYQTGFTPIYTSNYGPVGQIQYAQANSPQVYLAKVPQPYAAYSQLQLSQMPQKLAYAGPQITYTPQTMAKAYLTSPVAYPQVQLAYAQPQLQQASYQPQVQHATYQQNGQQAHGVPHVGPLAYQHSYRFVPMDAISLNYPQQQQQAVHNQGVVTHTQAIPHQQHYANPTHATPAGNVQLVYPNIAATATPKPAVPVYATYQDGGLFQQQQQHQQPQQTYAYAIQPSIQIASAKQIIAPIPTIATQLPTYQYKPLIAAQATQTSHGHNGATSFTTIQQHLNHAQPTAVTHLKVASVAQPVYQAYPQYYTHQPMQHTLGKSLAYGPVAQASSPAIYSQHGAVHYGSHLYPVAYNKLG